MPRPLVARPCQECGTVFGSRKPASRYCSKSCVWKAIRGPAFNQRVGREFGWKSGETQRGRGEGKAYRKLLGRHEHRVVAEHKLGRALLPGEIVHHIDGDKLNNEPENLAVMTQAEHIFEHEPWNWRRW